MATIMLVVALLIVVAFVIRDSEAVDYDDVDDAIPVDVLSEPLWTDGPDGANAAKLWPNRTAIPYEISVGLDDKYQRLVKRALRTMERSTDACVLFKKRTDERDYLYFMNSTASTSHSLVGMQGGLQVVPYTANSNDSDRSVIGDVLHQTMCALGFPHEHQRPDRNDYIDINYDEIKYGGEDAFTVNRDMRTFGTKYDYHSIMHNSAYAYSKSTRPVIVPKKGLIIELGRYFRLSPGDIAKIKRAYKCPMRISYPDTGLPQITEPFPKFSLEPMSYDKCRLQYNDYCTPTESISDLCGVDSSRKDFQIRCYANANATVLEQMSLSMAQGVLRPVSIFLHESSFRQYTFAPIKRQVITASVWHCTSDRSTGWLIQTNFSSLLEFKLFDCSDLIVTRHDFTSSRKLRIIVFADCTMKALERGTFDNFPDLRILSLEALWNDSSSKSEYGKFDQRMQTYLYNIHCSCEFAWFRSWWTNSKLLKIKVNLEEVYSIAGSYGSAAYRKEDLYHPIDCAASPFPAGTEWINYYTQVKYSINEPKCEKVQRCQNLLQALVANCI